MQSKIVRPPGLARVVVIDSVGACYWSDKVCGHGHTRVSRHLCGAYCLPCCPPQAWQPGAGKSQAAHIAYASQRLAERHAVTVFCAKPSEWFHISPPHAHHFLTHALCCMLPAPPELFAKTSADYHTVWNRVATHHVDLMSVSAGHTAATAAASAAAAAAAADAGPPSTR